MKNLIKNIIEESKLKKTDILKYNSFKVAQRAAERSNQKVFLGDDDLYWDPAKVAAKKKGYSQLSQIAKKGIVDAIRALREIVRGLVKVKLNLNPISGLADDLDTVSRKISANGRLIDKANAGINE